MKFFQNTTEVTFTALDKAFNVSSVFCEFSMFGHMFSIKWYGVIIAFGLLLAVLFGGRIAYTWKMSLEKMVDVLIYGMLGGIIGARAYYVIFSWDNYKNNFADVFKIWEGGLAIYGGIIGGLLAAFITCKIIKLNFYNLLDIAGMSLLIGQGIGRWGNFANQEAFGTNTDLPWGMYSEKICSYIIRNQSSLPGVDPYKPVHPTFLYESIWCIVGFIILYIILKKARKFSGQLFLCYGIWYGIGRTIIEGLRTDSLYIVENLRASQLLSLILVAVCSVLLIVKLVKYTKNPQPIGLGDMGDGIITAVPFGKGGSGSESKEESTNTESKGDDGNVQTD